MTHGVPVRVLDGDLLILLNLPFSEGVTGSPVRRGEDVVGRHWTRSPTTGVSTRLPRCRGRNGPKLKDSHFKAFVETSFSSGVSRRRRPTTRGWEKGSLRGPGVVVRVRTGRFWTPFSAVDEKREGFEEVPEYGTCPPWVWRTFPPLSLDPSGVLFR